MILAFWCNKNTDQIDRLFRASGLYRDKWDEKHGSLTYGQMTLERAVAICTETYTPTREKPPAEIPDPAKPLDLIFPADVMTGVAGDFARLYASYLESPAEFLYFSFLAHLGAILSGRVTAETELSPQPRLFCLLLGESADDRKSTAITKTSEFFREALTSGSLMQSWGVGSAEGLAGLFDESNGGNKRVLLSLDEFKQFVSNTSILGLISRNSLDSIDLSILPIPIHSICYVVCPSILSQFHHIH
jgi:hypothetical protein